MTNDERKGRDAYERRAWREAYDAFCRASAEGPLSAPDVELWAWSAVLSGHDAASLDALERLHQLRLDAGEVLPAIRAAFWLAMRSMSLGEAARASGWFARAQRLLERAGNDCVEAGYLRLPLARISVAGDHEAARAHAAAAAEIGERYGDADLLALARNLEGRVLLGQGRHTEGLPLVDEAMVAVTSGALSPVVTGIIYCSVIASCQQTYALGRAREWTRALSDWCDSQPELIAFAGACLIHRSEILQLGGNWSEALEEARRATARLAQKTDGEAGNAAYQEGEIHRLRGELEQAEQAYVLASERGREPQPGLALLRVAQGRAEVALAAMRRVLSQTTDPMTRTRFLPAHVEISLASSRIDEARAASEELTQLAARFQMETLGAIAQHAAGAVLLAEGDAQRALEPLQRSQEVWQRLGAPYLNARIRCLLGRAFRALGDEDGARLELDAARKTFVTLGATPDLAAIDALTAAPPLKEPTATPANPPGPSRGAHGLSTRELEVLLLVASGKTNKLIAKELFLSEKTIDRHVSNIFNKLGVPTRAAATAWAYQHGLLTT